MNGELIKKQTVCLIGGSGRSGTRILRKTFSSHPDVARIDTELRFLIDPDGLLDFYLAFIYGGWSPQLFSVKIDRLRRLLTDVGKGSGVHSVVKTAIKKLGLHNLHKKLPYKAASRYSLGMKRVCPDYSSLVDELIEKLVEFRYKGLWVGSGLLSKPELFYSPPLRKNELAETLGNFYRKVARSVTTRQGAKYLFDSTPWSILWFDKILELLPEARLVHVYREPRDVVSSFARQNWAPSDIAQAARFYDGIMERWWEVRALLPAGSYIEIHLEDLVMNTKTVLEDVCRFLNISWDESLMLTDFSRSHSGRWKKELTEKEQEQVSDLLSGQLRRMGYQGCQISFRLQK